MEPIDREPNLFELPLKICYCVPGGASRCVPCRARRKEKEEDVAVFAALYKACVGSIPAPATPPPAAPSVRPGPPLPALGTAPILGAGSQCPQCGMDYLRPHPVSRRPMCTLCSWASGDVVRGFP